MNQTVNAGERAKPVFEYDASRSRFDYAWNDLKQGLARPRLIWTFVRSGFMNRYQGTYLGGFWITLTTGMTVAGLALLYGQIFGVALKAYFPYVAFGIVFWGLLSSIVNEAVSVFLGGAGVFNQTPITKSVFALKTIGISIAAFAYKAIILVAVVLIMSIDPGWRGWALSALGFLMIVWTGFWLTLSLGAIGARFRDLGQLTNAALTFAFFLTPVIWTADRLGKYTFVVQYNPFHHYLNIVRGPILGLGGVDESFLWAGGCTVLVTIASWFVYGMFARRLCYWS